MSFWKTVSASCAPHEPYLRHEAGKNVGRRPRDGTRTLLLTLHSDIGDGTPFSGESDAIASNSYDVNMLLKSNGRTIDIGLLGGVVFSRDVTYQLQNFREQGHLLEEECRHTDIGRSKSLRIIKTIKGVSGFIKKKNDI